MCAFAGSDSRCFWTTVLFSTQTLRLHLFHWRMLWGICCHTILVLGLCPARLTLSQVWLNQEVWIWQYCIKLLSCNGLNRKLNMWKICHSLCSRQAVWVCFSCSAETNQRHAEQVQETTSGWIPGNKWCHLFKISCTLLIQNHWPKSLFWNSKHHFGSSKYKRWQVWVVIAFFSRRAHQQRWWC